MDNSSGCIVSSYTHCNSATDVLDGATGNTTRMQPRSLLSLATRVLERNRCNRKRNQTATPSLHQDIINATENDVTKLHRGATDISLNATGGNQKSCTVAFPIEHNHATHFTCQQCSYRKPFCSCKLIAGQGIAICNDCEHFTMDNIGDGTGIGNCELGIKWTQEFSGRMPLFRDSERHCKQFTKLMD